MGFFTLYTDTPVTLTVTSEDGDSTESVITWREAGNLIHEHSTAPYSKSSIRAAMVGM